MFWDLFLITALAIWLYMSILFAIALWLKDNSIVDIGWGIGFFVEIVPYSVRVCRTLGPILS